MSDMRDDLRTRIFSAEASTPKRMEIEFFGVTLELRQPSIGMLLDMQQGDDRKRVVIDMIIQYSYVPGTNEHIFEDADADTLLSMPWGDDFARMNDAISKLTGVNVREEEGN